MLPFELLSIRSLTENGTARQYMTDPDIMHEIGRDDSLDQWCAWDIVNFIDIALYQFHESVVHVEIYKDVSDLDVVCVIGQGRPSHPLVSLRCRSTA